MLGVLTYYIANQFTAIKFRAIIGIKTKYF
jgi:hypothetical protein